MLYDVSMRFTSLEWNEALTDRENNKFKNIAYDITKKVRETFYSCVQGIISFMSLYIIEYLILHSNFGNKAKE